MALRRGRPGDPVPRGAPPVAGRGILAAVVLFSLALLLSSSAMLLLGPGVPGLAGNRRALLLLDTGGKLLALLGTALLLRSTGGARDPGPARAGRAAAAGAMAALAFLPVMMATGFLQGAVWRAMGRTLETQGLVEFATRGSDADFALVLVTAVVVAPLFEETLFRVHLYSGLRARLGPVACALLTAALFALVHGQAVAYPVTFLLGLWLAYLRERTGGRSAPIAMHACYNTVQMAGILALRLALRDGGGGTTGG